METCPKTPIHHKKFLRSPEVVIRAIHKSHILQTCKDDTFLFPPCIFRSQDMFISGSLGQDVAGTTRGPTVLHNSSKVERGTLKFCPQFFCEVEDYHLPEGACLSSTAPVTRPHRLQLARMTGSAAVALEINLAKGRTSTTGFLSITRGGNTFFKHHSIAMESFCDCQHFEKILLTFFANCW